MQSTSDQAGAAEGVFVADVNKVGTFGDLLGGPTELDRTEDYDPGREVLNRIKFGTEGALFSGVIGGTGAAIGKLINRNKNLTRSDDAMDSFLDKFAGKLRARSQKDPEFFKVERRIEGLKSEDIALAKQTQREINVCASGNPTSARSFRIPEVVNRLQRKG